MKILYRQPDLNNDTLFEKYGINQCYLKQIEAQKDFITKQEHHHTGFEIHIIKNGYQTYEINKKNIKICGGQFFLVPPRIKHRMVDSSEQISKYAVTFNIDTSSLNLTHLTQAVIEPTPFSVFENINYIETIQSERIPFYDALTESRLFETVILLLTACGLKQETAPACSQGENSRLTLVKQFIADNINQNLSVADISRYCYLSEKQLSRLFLQYENTTPQKYIQQKRIKQIQKLLENESLTLKEISEEMNFNNEYYFSTFFKKHCGLPPGAYRKMHE